jgi:hypothetical protein
MKLDMQTYDDAKMPGGKPITATVGVIVSAHNAVQLADRVLRDGRTPTDGIFRRTGTTFFGVTGESDDIHYAGRTLPSLEERVQFLERLVESASATLENLDPEGLVRLRIASRFDDMARRLGTHGDVAKHGNNIAFGPADER